MRVVFFDAVHARPALKLQLFAEWIFHKVYESLGSHVRTIEHMTGVHFVEWAPNAARGNVLGDFIRWDGRCHP